MDRAAERNGTATRPEPAQAGGARETGSRALVTLAAPGPRPAATGGRPLAGFLTQLMLGADPALRPARLQRTRAAAALYARAAGDGSDGSGA